MVFIKKIESRGFKSFGTSNVSVKLEKGLTAITGPNGSGKSNIIDSIIFCLGQNSPKKMRVNRLTSLIYDGGHASKRPQNIRVSLTFDNMDRRIPIDSDNVTVTRELKQTGENNYYINNKRYTKTSISGLLELALITPEGLNLVPQGMITRISELNPDEKRGLIEEIAGVAQFEEKKKNAMDQLREADVKLQVALARIGEMRNRVESLEGEMNDQLRLKNLEEEIRWLKSTITSKNLSNIQIKINEKKKLLDEYNLAANRLNMEISELDNYLEKLEKDRREFVTKVIDSSGGERVELEFAIGRNQSEIHRLDEDIKEANNIVSKIENSIPLLTNLMNKQDKEIHSFNQRIIEEEKNIQDLETKKINSENNLKKIRNNLTILKARISKNRVKESNINNRILEKNQKLNEIIRRIDVEKNNKLTNSERLSLLNEKSRTFLSTINTLDDQLKKLEDLMKVENGTLEQVGLSIKNMDERESKLKEEVFKALSILNKVDSNLIRYDTQRSVAEKFASDEIGLRRLEDLAKTGALEGFIGRFDTIIKFDLKYETAVLSAGRRWLKGIVVKDLKAMLKIIEITKRLKIKDITILPLSEVSDSKRVRLPRSKRCIGNLADYIKSHNKFESLVNFLFGDIILVDNLRDGFNISSQGFKTVTLSGELFENRSTLFETGYHSEMDELINLIRGEASLKSVRDALKSLQKTITRRKSDIEQLQKESKKLNQEKSNRTIIIERMKAETLTVHNFIKKYRSLEKGIKNQIRKYDKIDKRIGNKLIFLKKYHDTYTTRISSLKSQVQNLQIAEINSEIINMEKKSYLELETVDNLSRKLREKVTQITKDKANLQHNLYPNFLRLKEQIENYQETLSEKEFLISKSNLKLNEISEKLELLRKEERETINKNKKSRPILERYDNRIKNLQKKRDNSGKSLINIEKEILSTNKSIELFLINEKNLIGELSLYGFNEPIKYFEMAESLLTQLNKEYNDLRNNVNLLAVNSYKEIFSGYKNLSIRRNQLESERDAVVKFIEEIEGEKRNVFINNYERIDKELRSIFSKLTGGSAWLELEDSSDIFSKGVFLMTQFPEKLARESSSVSGGEKTVSALSLILAIQSVYPSPFYLFDEIDAHLDGRNSEKLAELLKERSDSSQIITVTLKDTVLTRASLVYGIYMERGESKIIKYLPNMEVISQSG